MSRPARRAAPAVCAIVLTATALPGAAAAHDLWLEPAGGGYALRYGHHGGERLPLDAAKVKAIRCRSGAGDTRDLRGVATVRPTEVTVAGPCAAVSAALDGGFYSLTPDGEKNLPRDQVPDAVRSWASRQSAKWLDARQAGAATPMGDELEIVPVTDLGRARAGDKISVRVLLDGKPVSDAVLSVEHRPVGETDGEGVVRFRARRAGVQTVSASLRRPLATPQAEALVLEASLTFEVPP